MTGKRDDHDERPKVRVRRIVVFVSAQVVLALILFEIALRIGMGVSVNLRRLLFLPGTSTEYSKATTVQELIGMSPRGFTPGVRHGDFILNSRGLKTSEYSYDKPDGAYRIVILGDSFTFASGGVPYESLWHVQTERMLEEIGGSDVEVLSLGVPAIGPDFYQRMWEVEGRRLDADLVLVAFFVGNDLLGPDRELLPPQPLDWLYRTSFVARFARNLRLRTMGIVTQPPHEAVDGSALSPGSVIAGGHEYDPNAPSMTPESFYRVNRIMLWTFTDNNRDALRLQVVHSTARLGEIGDQVLASGAEYAVMLIPTEVQVDDVLREMVARDRQFDGQGFDTSYPNRAIVEWCAENQVPCLDLLPDFSRHELDSKLYRMANTHWNIEGNSLAAARLTEFIVEIKGE